MKKPELERLKTYLRDYVESITRKSKGKDKYVCPLCGSGTGEHRTGAFTIGQGGTHWECFSCGKGGDLFDLIGEYETIPTLQERIERAKELFPNYGASPTNRIKQQKQENPKDYTSFYVQANHNLPELVKNGLYRGITIGTLNAFHIGYVKEWRHEKAPESAPFTPRLIIPTSEASYLARDIRPVEEVPKRQKPYIKSKTGKNHIFNLSALQTAASPIYVTEGELDALSVIDVGGQAIALGSISMINKFLAFVKNSPPVQPLIISLDNDEAGKEATEKLTAGLEELGISFYTGNPAGKYKDANEALQADREAFTWAVQMGERSTEEVEKAEYLKSSNANYLEDFINGINASVNTPATPTGYSRLDEVLDGGLYEGLYVLGAVSSLGKTTYITQMADQIARGTGQDVLIFSLEMARNELIAKSISRETVIQVLLEQKEHPTGGNVMIKAKTVRGITDGRRYQTYSKEERDTINRAIASYDKYANRIFIIEGVGDIGAHQIRKAIQRHIHCTGNRPVVVVDYLQILAPYNERATDKQNTDKAVLEMKRISRDYKIPVIAISSLNRASYGGEIAMQAFKESGAIEYSSDVLIGLQFKGAGGDGFDGNKARRAMPREIELVILKNRNGRTGDIIPYRYYPAFNYFEEE